MSVSPIDYPLGAAPGNELDPLDPSNQSREVRILLAAARGAGRTLLPDELQIPPGATPDIVRAVQERQLVWARMSAALGLDFDNARLHVYVGTGVPGITAEMARKCAEAQGCDIVLVSASATAATVKARSRGSDWSVVEYTIEDAQRNGFLDVSYVDRRQVAQQHWIGHAVRTPREWFHLQFDVLEGVMVRTPMKEAPAWVARFGERKWRAGYHTNPLNMLAARASSIATRMVNPVPTINGVRVRVADLDTPRLGENAEWTEDTGIPTVIEAP